VGNLNFRANEKDLEEMFKKFGSIKDVYIPQDQSNGNSRGFAFITFHNESDADDAVDEMDDKEVDGRPLRVNKARARPPVSGRSRERGGGGGGGGGRGRECRDYARGKCERGSQCRFLHTKKSRSRSRSRRGSRS